MSPIDAIPDLTPFVGYTDDLSMLAFALSALAFYVNAEVKANAQQTLSNWFDKVDPDELESIHKRL